MPRAPRRRPRQELWKQISYVYPLVGGRVPIRIGKDGSILFTLPFRCKYCPNGALVGRCTSQAFDSDQKMPYVSAAGQSQIWFRPRNVALKEYRTRGERARSFL